MLMETVSEKAKT